MGCKKCGCGRCMALCPFSFGLALGITCGLVVFIWTLWAMYYGVPEMMIGHMPEPTLIGGATHALWALLKGFVFGFVFALIYDMIKCCCRGWCCRKSNGSSCNCACGSSDKPVAGK